MGYLTVGPGARGSQQDMGTTGTHQEQPLGITGGQQDMALQGHNRISRGNHLSCVVILFDIMARAGEFFCV